MSCRENPASKSFAARHLVPAHHDEVEQLSDRDGDHGERDAPPAHHQGPEQRRRNAAHQSADDDRKRRTGREIFQRHAGAIGAQPKVCRLPERKAAGEIQHQVEPHRGDGVDEHLGAKRRIPADRRQPPWQCDQGNPHRHNARQPASFEQPSSPNNPRGRTTSTISIIR